jgi:NarL family two-component system response regulator LiaR
MRHQDLTRREREVVDLVVRGLTNRQIAEELFLSEKTVENHIGRILVKMDLPSRTRLAAYAIEHGLTSKSA